MDPQQIENLTVIVVVVVLVLVFMIVTGDRSDRKELCQWRAAGGFLLLGVCVLLINVIFTWALSDNFARFQRGLFLHNSIGVPPASSIPLAYSFFIASGGVIICRVFSKLKMKLKSMGSK